MFVTMNIYTNLNIDDQYTLKKACHRKTHYLCEFVDYLS